MIHRCEGNRCSYRSTPSRGHKYLRHAPQCHQSHHHHTHARLKYRTRGPWIDVHTLVVDRGPIPPRMVVRSSWFPSENVVLGGRTEGNNHIPMWSSIQASLHLPQLQTICTMCISSLHQIQTMYVSSPRINSSHKPKAWLSIYILIKL